MIKTLDIFLLLMLASYCTAYELHQGSNEVQSTRGIGIEEVALFLVGLGVASVLGLAIVIGPLIAVFYTTSLSASGGSNTVSLTAGGSRMFDKDALRSQLAEKLTSGLNILEEALRKYDKA